MKFWMFVFALFTSSVAARAVDPAVDVEVLKAELVKAETDFCALAAKAGVLVAFRAYVAPDGFFLSTGPDVRGVEIVNRVYAGAKPGTSLAWKPLVVDVAASGDLGYTTGTYVQLTPGENGAPEKRETGRYFTIWKRQKDGAWKFALDGGAADPAPKKE